ncbi:MAG: hypothetical protein AAFR21_10515 [Pseudomonadota bacterium]
MVATISKPEVATSAGRKKRVLYLAYEYPQASQTYIFSEIEALKQDYEIHVISLRPAPDPMPSSVPVTVTDRFSDALALAKEFKPDLLHGHWLYLVIPLSRLSKRLGVPYTIRAHSFDTMIKGQINDPLRDRLRRIRSAITLREYRRPSMPRAMAHLIKQDNCLGVLTFPFTQSLFTEAGVSEKKIIVANPVVDFARFENRSPNAPGVMNVGACIAKKKIPDFIDLAAMTPEQKFRLYPIGYLTEEMRQYNEQKGSPVEFRQMVPYEDMPGEYKRHSWLVYTGGKPGPRGNAIGWPMAIAEAQASGCGVCVPNVRPDIRDYIGDGAIVYDDIRELPEIIRDDPPEALREAGFRQAAKSDINKHKKVLTDLWLQA